jgi:hypothetical protein
MQQFPKPADTELEAQNRIADTLLQLVEQIQKLKESIDRLEPYFKSLTGTRPRN